MKSLRVFNMFKAENPRFWRVESDLILKFVLHAVTFSWFYPRLSRDVTASAGGGSG